MVTYAVDNAFKGRLAIQTIRGELCGFFAQTSECADSGERVDSLTGHTVCLGCKRITVESGLRCCDICEREYIDSSKFQNPRYETNCPSCVVKYGL